MRYSLLVESTYTFNADSVEEALRMAENFDSLWQPESEEKVNLVDDDGIMVKEWQ